MNIQKIKELALANGFSLKEQASGNMDLHSYVYEFAQAIENEVLAQARSVFGQDGVTTFDTETLDSEIDQISDSMSEKHFFDNDESDELELLVAKSMKLGELYERKKWQEAKTQDIPEGFVLVPKNELTTTYYWDGAEYVVNCVSEYEIDLGKGEIAELEKWEQTKSTKAFFANIYSDEDNFEIVEFDSIDAAQLAVRENKAMIEAQEQGHESK